MPTISPFFGMNSTNILRHYALAFGGFLLVQLAIDFLELILVFLPKESLTHDEVIAVRVMKCVLILHVLHLLAQFIMAYQLLLSATRISYRLMLRWRRNLIILCCLEIILAIVYAYYVSLVSPFIFACVLCVPCKLLLTWPLNVHIRDIYNGNAPFARQGEEERICRPIIPININDNTDRNNSNPGNVVPPNAQRPSNSQETVSTVAQKLAQVASQAAVTADGDADTAPAAAAVPTPTPVNVKDVCDSGTAGGTSSSASLATDTAPAPATTELKSNTIPHTPHYIENEPPSSFPAIEELDPDHDTVITIISKPNGSGGDNCTKAATGLPASISKNGAAADDSGKEAGVPKDTNSGNTAPAVAAPRKDLVTGKDNEGFEQ